MLEEVFGWRRVRWQPEWLGNIPFGVFTRRHENCGENDGGRRSGRPGPGRVTEKPASTPP